MKVQKKSSVVKTTSSVSNCGGFRFLLSKYWEDESELKPRALFICENPSFADELMYDQTLANITSLSVQWGWSGFELVNLHPSYSSDSDNIQPSKEAEEINSKFINEAVARHNLIVVATGEGYIRVVKKIIRKYPDKQYLCISNNADGSGRHPSRLKIKDYPKPKPYKAIS
ncbi:TPA: DUF1643 domain-containing protein [Vibrio diabolicus]|uniref:DUF1643 domain-containing protein n=1 Tax=Vibrio TaxID=662 RepID=UPI00068D2555|nr:MULTISPECIES: DUF1643 domain-containing protein [Vibrio]MCS0204227.1 DUF1643 domain-containing protein [Vibrio sp. HS-50-1]HBC3497147.1 DUF1643 domain-containing protein [Vibrio parahaemolyticus]